MKTMDVPKENLVLCAITTLIHTQFQKTKAQYINEPWIIDKSICYKKDFDLDQGGAEDNIRVYMPLDISADVNLIISQVEIYDQIWGERHGMNEKGHSTEAIALIREIVAVLEKIPDGCAEFFPFEIIDELQSKYL